MAKQVHVIVVTPPIDGEMQENMKFNGCRCPGCSGAGVRMESRGSGGDYLIKCEHCRGTGKMKAEVQINWMPDI